MVNNSIEESFFYKGQKRQPKTKENKDTETSENKRQDTEKLVIFLGKDLLSVLGQGTPRKSPAKNKIETREEPNSPEMNAEIKELFWEDDKIIF